MNYYRACEEILAACPNGYAKAYANAGLTLTDTHAQKVQALYILNNISGWRTPTAKTVREFLKEFSKELR